MRAGLVLGGAGVVVAAASALSGGVAVVGAGVARVLAVRGAGLALTTRLRLVLLRGTSVCWHAVKRQTNTEGSNSPPTICLILVIR